jgi:hypothetical protein
MHLEATDQSADSADDSTGYYADRCESLNQRLGSFSARSVLTQRSLAASRAMASAGFRARRGCGDLRWPARLDRKAGPVQSVKIDPSRLVAKMGGIVSFRIPV